MSIHSKSLALCANGKKVKKQNGSILFICNSMAYFGEHCPYVRICRKSMDYAMSDSVVCEEFTHEKRGDNTPLFN